MLTPDEIKALELKKAGADNRQIAEQLDTTPAKARRLVAKALKALYSPREQALDQDRRLECARLDSYLMKMSKAINAGDNQAINIAVRISDRRSKLWGLDAPVQVEQKVEQTIKVIPPDEQNDTDSDNS